MLSSRLAGSTMDCGSDVAWLGLLVGMISGGGSGGSGSRMKERRKGKGNHRWVKWKRKAHCSVGRRIR